MKRLAFLVLVGVLPIVAAAQDQTNATTELLNARHATKFIRIGLVPDTQGGDKYSLQYGVDGFDDLETLADGLVFRTDAGAKIYLANFNPLTQTFTINSEASADVSYASLKSFFDDLQKAQANLTATLPAKAGALGLAATTVSACSTLIDLVNKLHRDLKDEEFSATLLSQTVEGATGYAGVKEAATTLQQKKKEIDDNVTDAQETLRTLRTDYSSLAGAPPKNDCLGNIEKSLTAANNMIVTKDFTSQQKSAAIAKLEAQRAAVKSAVATFNDIQTKADDIISKKKKLSDSIGDLLKTLGPYLVMAHWRGPIPNNAATLTDYDFKKITPDFVNQQKVTVTAKAKDVVLEKDVIVVKELDASKQTASFRMRQDSLLIPERAVAAVYNRLKYPKYSAGKNDAGKTVVMKTNDDDPWNGALLLNLVMRLGRPSVANPMLQFGVSTAKDYPAFLAGIGLRFTQPVALGLSFGGMVTRFKDLDNNLSVGSEVTGDADIQKHLVYRTSPVVPYLAVQVKF